MLFCTLWSSLSTSSSAVTSESCTALYMCMSPREVMKASHLYWNHLECVLVAKPLYCSLPEAPWSRPAFVYPQRPNSVLHGILQTRLLRLRHPDQQTKFTWGQGRIFALYCSSEHTDSGELIFRMMYTARICDDNPWFSKQFQVFFHSFDKKVCR